MHCEPQIGFDLFHPFVTWWDGYYWLQVFVWANFVFEYSISSVIDASYIVSSESELSFGQVILFHKWTSVACQKSGFYVCCTITAVKEWSHWRRDPKQKGETHTFATMHIWLLLICLLSTESSLSNELFIDFSVEGTPIKNFWSSTGMTPQVHLIQKSRRLDHPAPGAMWPDQGEAAAAVFGHGKEPGSHWVTSWQHNHTGATDKPEEYIF